MPVDRKTFPTVRFTLTDFDVDLILKGIAKVFLRIAPTIIHDKQNDVLPPYVFVQCNVSLRVSTLSDHICISKTVHPIALDFLSQIQTFEDGSSDRSGLFITDT